MVIISTRFESLRFRRASHSAMKLLEAPLCWRLSTLTATIFLPWSRISWKRTRQLLQGVCHKASIRTAKNRGMKVLKKAPPLFFLSQHHTRNAINVVVRSPLTIEIVNFIARGNFPLFGSFPSHLGNCNSVTPPQSFMFSMIETSLAFLKPPCEGTVGTSPRNH